jgi:hypothetical protein
MKMKIGNLFSYLDAEKKFKHKRKLFLEITRILNVKEIVFGLHGSKEIKQKINYRFNNKGWADKIKIRKTNLTISFVKNRIGVCCQLGNVARTYADVLKLALMHKNKIIDMGIIIVPHKFESKKLGANYAQYERLTSELESFKNIINVPILIIGLSN